MHPAFTSSHWVYHVSPYAQRKTCCRPRRRPSSSTILLALVTAHTLEPALVVDTACAGGAADRRTPLAARCGGTSVEAFEERKFVGAKRRKRDREGTDNLGPANTGGSAKDDGTGSRSRSRRRRRVLRIRRSWCLGRPLGRPLAGVGEVELAVLLLLVAFYKTTASTDTATLDRRKGGKGEKQEQE